MAADSAVTIAGKKVYNSANKLFMLSKYHPVGIMVYGNAEFMGFPWEVLIKLYREELGKKEFDTIANYAEHFFDFLSTSEHIGQQDEAAYVTQTAFPIYAETIKRIRNSIERLIQKNGTASDKDTQSIISTEVSKMFDEISQREYYFEQTTKTEARLAKIFASALSSKILSVFDKLPISSALQTKLVKIGVMAITRKIFDHASGVVFSGFGKTEIFPSMLSCEINCRANKKLIRSRADNAGISLSIANGSTAVIKPFAQGEMVHAFMEGIDPYLNRLSSKYLETVFREFPQKILEQLNLANDDTLKQGLLKAGQDVFENYQRALKDYQRINHVDPVLNAVASLPKDELAAMAESLINLTSFKRKVTIETETVGGAIDVAVISKGDGFIWIKRKHYFPPQLNHHFTANYFEE